MWTSKWPDKVGCYLFFGDLKPKNWVSSRNVPKFTIVHVWKTGNDTLAYVGDGRFLYKSDTVGVFRPFDEAAPESWDTEL